MNGGSTSNRTPAHRQLPRMILLIHESTLTPQLLNKLIRARFIQQRGINVLRVRQGIRRHRVPIEESQDKESCAPRPMFGQRADIFSRRTICKEGEARRLSLYWAPCCNRLPLESA